MSSSSNAQKSGTAPVPHQMLISGTAAAWAEFCTIPLDTCKVRLQIQQSGSAPKYTGLFNCLTTMAKEEGLFSLWKGVSAGIQRQLAFAPIRIGLYEPVRNFYMGENKENKDPSMPIKIAAGLTTSAIGITIASPTDVVKVRLQAEGRLPAGVPRRYNGSIDAYRKIVSQEGLKGLWTGYAPNLARNCVVNATELVAYDQAKQTLTKDFGLEEGTYVHILSALFAGLSATLLGSPVDVVKTRVMNAKKDASGKSPYRGPIDCAIQMLKNEGPLAFYKGFIPNFARIGGWNLVAWVSLEKIKRLYWEYYYADHQQ